MSRSKATASILFRFSNSFRSSLRHYRAALVKEFGGPLIIEERPKEPHFSQREVLVRVKSAGVNYTDLLIVRGTHHLKPVLPFVPGFEFSGEIEAIGKDVKEFQVGDRVVALKTHSSGAYAEICAVKESEVYKIPYSLSYDVAASLPSAYGSAYLSLNEVAKAAEGDMVLIITSQGASGIAAIDVALNVFRCQVIVASDSQKKLQMVRPDGVLATVAYKDENMVAHVKKYAKDGVDIIVDTVGGSCFTQALNCLKPGGQILCLGFTSGKVPTVDIQTLIKNRATVHGVSLGGLAQSKPEVFHEIIQKIIGFLDEQYISPHLSVQFPLDNVNEALEYIEKKNTFGKVILNI